MVYVADDTSATLTVPQNKGYEAMVYLTYLIDHYDNLPEIMVFMHAGRISWHNNALLLARADLMVNKLNITTVLRQGFVGLACDAHLQRHIGSVPNVAGISSLELTREDWFTNPQDLPRIAPTEWHQRYLDLWESLFPNTPAPLTIDAPKGGQFALSRQTAMLVPKEKLSRLRDWLIATPLPSKCAGAVFEALWHLIFLGPTNSSISTQSSVCYCQLYDICPQQGSTSEEQANLVFDASVVMALQLLDNKEN
ncbi:hypothetical protein BU24DRAFT_463196 [Aaosphaeria arxii CBS 175.79]|uniref:Uncharacterized protein n=1 Tax=Aaosphaeria arxii CBS 175.79 TaxID=1450172 RepID=A0A6A5XPY1_9PLEO|nr:uncharacterized protein BU24DRAFT_463196 [Aaosphaeria arxii CBS 175.79]KAF2014404.1 hypothetical protein BU24DRAFT_463196 [Aaosphaeria arxii CBS 175.79]